MTVSAHNMSVRMIFEVWRVEIWIQPCLPSSSFCSVYSTPARKHKKTSLPLRQMILFVGAEPPGADPFSRKMWKPPLTRYRLNHCCTDSIGAPESKAVFSLCLIIKCLLFQKNTLNVSFGGTPLQKETKMLSLWHTEGDYSLSPAIVWNVVLLM